MDLDMILHFISESAILHHLPDLFGIFRVHGKQKSQADFLSCGVKEMALLRKRYDNEKIGCIRRARLHWYYLSRHRHADAEFDARVFG